MKGFYLKSAADEYYWVLKKHKCCVTLIKTARKEYCSNMTFEMMRIFEMTGFKTKDITIKEQHNYNATGYWKTNSKKINLLLHVHEYLCVKKQNQATKSC